MKITFMKKKMIILGNQAVREITLLEYKPLFSLKLFHFIKTNGSQDRFHTHAFDAYSLRLWGDYIEEVIVDNVIIKLKRSRKRILFIPKDSYHRITRSVGCVTILLTGAWGKEFKELRKEGDSYREYFCGEKRIDLRQGKLVNLKEKENDIETHCKIQGVRKKLGW